MNFPASVIVTDQDIDLSQMTLPQKEYCIKLTNDLSHIYRDSGKPRMIFGFAGPSGVGKSTLVVILRNLLSQKSIRAEHLGIDAYHYHNKNLKEMGLISRKGRHDTYDVQRLEGDLLSFRTGRSIYFPEYSRKSHEPISGGSHWEEGERGILLVEGLWLLYGKSGWGELKKMLDMTYYIDEDSTIANKRTIDRHVRGGRSIAEAELFYRESDRMNARLVAQTRRFADRVVKLP